PSAQHSVAAPGVMDTDAMRRSWPEVLDKVKSMRRVTWSFVSVNTQIVDFDGRRLLLQIGTAGQAETFRRGNHAEVVRQALIEAIGVDTTVESTVAGSDHGGAHEPRRPRTRSAPDDPRTGTDQGPAAATSRSARDRPSAASPRSAAEPDWGHGTTEQPPPWAQQPQGGEPPPSGPVRASTQADPSAGRGGDIPSQDDDDLENSTTVGQSVIESVLGGKVISIDDPAQR
ncbi:MAG: hypothetical protein WA962_12865, partial [Ornithinimicrobium sp.]